MKDEAIFLYCMRVMLLILGFAIYLGGTTELYRQLGLVIGLILTGSILTQIVQAMFECARERERENVR